MKIGMLSDTHGHLAATAAAARHFLDAGAGAVFHCGDIGGMDVLVELAGVLQPASIPVHAVLGNVDLCADDWKFFPSNMGIQLHGRFGDIRFFGLRIALLHGDESRRYHQTVFCGLFDLVLSGHTHEIHDFLHGRTRCINPGAAGRTKPGTCAVLDLNDGALEFMHL